MSREHGNGPSCSVTLLGHLSDLHVGRASAVLQLSCARQDTVRHCGMLAVSVTVGTTLNGNITKMLVVTNPPRQPNIQVEGLSLLLRIQPF